MRLTQPQVHADGMELLVPRHLQHAVQQAATLGAGDGDVEVLVADDGKFREQGVAMVAVGIDRIAPVGEIGPDAVGEKLVLGRLRPVVKAHRVLFVGAQHFLQEHHVR